MPPMRDGHQQQQLIIAEPFSGFGPSRFCPVDEATLTRIIRGGTQPRLKAQVRAFAPREPGVYGMLDPRRRIIYVGKAKNLRNRLLSYFRTQSRDPKAGRILKQTRTLLWEQTADEFSALLRELELIRRFRPRFNVIGQPGQQRYVYLCIGKAPAPTVYLSPNPTGKERAIFGPLVGRGQLDEAIRRLNDAFGLRDCPSTIPMVFADQPRLFVEADSGARCLRYDIQTCLGPCAGLCSRQQYEAKVRATRAFLEGRDRSLLQKLHQHMLAASAALRFEQASSFRDRLQILTRLDERLEFLRTARRKHSFLYPLTNTHGATVWYLVLRGEVCAAIRPERNPTQARATVEAVYASGTPAVWGEGCAESVLLVSAWFRKFPQEKAKLVPVERALQEGFSFVNPPTV
ncbi:MAG: GIY-YIG nuclease family protein [Bacteroidales bacterium]|nr:GIY-YIG nuclease family protein [Bacteroidales bacterium]